MMLPFKKILAPTDFSGASYVALERAVELAQNFQAELWLLYVVPLVPTPPAGLDFAFEVPEYEQALQNDAEERLKRVQEERVDSRVVSRSLVGHGDAAKEIVRLAREEEVHLIVIATHGLIGWRHLVYGSVTEEVVRISYCPVLTIRPPPTSVQLSAPYHRYGDVCGGGLGGGNFRLDGRKVLGDGSQQVRNIGFLSLEHHLESVFLGGSRCDGANGRVMELVNPRCFIRQLQEVADRG